MIHIKRERSQDGLISREEFMEFFRHDDFSNMVSTEDCHEIFRTVMKGSSDFSSKLINDVLADYGNGDIIAIDVKTTYYLLGEDATKILYREGIDKVVLQRAENELDYEIFVFKEGITPSHELAAALMLWNDYSIITKEEFEQLKQ